MISKKIKQLLARNAPDPVPWGDAAHPSPLRRDIAYDNLHPDPWLRIPGAIFAPHGWASRTDKRLASKGHCPRPGI